MPQKPFYRAPSTFSPREIQTLGEYEGACAHLQARKRNAPRPALRRERSACLCGLSAPGSEKIPYFHHKNFHTLMRSSLQIHTRKSHDQFTVDYFFALLLVAV